jgi:hypothetical protein
MCALCGVLGGPEHWTDAAAGADSAARRRERAARVALANRVLAQYAMRLDDWQGSAYMLSTATGKQEMVETLGHLWPAAERLSGRACDPLDPALLVRLERA